MLKIYESWFSFLHWEAQQELKVLGWQRSSFFFCASLFWPTLVSLSNTAQFGYIWKQFHITFPWVAVWLRSILPHFQNGWGQNNELTQITKMFSVMKCYHQTETSYRMVYCSQLTDLVRAVRTKRSEKKQIS